MHKHKKRQAKMKPSLYALQSELKSLMQSDIEEVARRLDALALEDEKAACLIGEHIGFLDPGWGAVHIGNGVYCTPNCLYTP